MVLAGFVRADGYFLLHLYRSGEEVLREGEEIVDIRFKYANVVVLDEDEAILCGGIKQLV